MFIPTDRKGKHTLSILKASKSNYLLFVPILGRFPWLNTFELACATKAESRVLLVIKNEKKITFSLGVTFRPLEHDVRPVLLILN